MNSNLRTVIVVRVLYLDNMKVLFSKRRAGSFVESRKSKSTIKAKFESSFIFHQQSSFPLDFVAASKL